MGLSPYRGSPGFKTSPRMDIANCSIADSSTLVRPPSTVAIEMGTSPPQTSVPIKVVIPDLDAGGRPNVSTAPVRSRILTFENTLQHRQQRTCGQPLQQLTAVLESVSRSHDAPL